MPTIVPLKCSNCSIVFERQLRNVSKTGFNHFCSLNCKGIYDSRRINCQCASCGKQFTRKPSMVSNTMYCSMDCSKQFRMTTLKNKSGTNRSKLEIYIEQCIKENYPSLVLNTNDRVVINGLELDFYFPDIKLAIELNGIFHYEPIFGKERLDIVQENDNRKFMKCRDKGIALAIVDTSNCKNLTNKSKSKYWTIIKSIIEKHLAVCTTLPE